MRAAAGIGAVLGVMLAGCGLSPAVGPDTSSAGVSAKAWNPLAAIVTREALAGFDSYDTDADARLSRWEVPFLSTPTFEALDRNHDGTISRDEGAPGQRDLEAGVGLLSRALEATFQHLDANADQRLDADELAVMREVLAVRDLPSRGLGYEAWVEALAKAPAIKDPGLRAVSASDKPPVCLVPGFFLPTHIWIPLSKKLREKGWVNQVTVPHWPSFGDIRDYSAAADFRIKKVLAATGAQQVELVGHSMGGLVLRYWVKRMGGAPLVRHYVSFGSPQHGTAIGHLWPCASTDQMLPSSAFLADLNAGDETPGSASYTSIRTNTDEIVLSTTSPILDGASNHLVPFAEHLELVWDPRAQAIALDALER